MKRSELPIILFAILTLVSIANILNAIVCSLPWYEYIFSAVNMCAGGVLALFIERWNKKGPLAYWIFVYGLIATSVLTVFFCTPSNLTGVLLLIEAIHIQTTNIKENRRIVIFVLTAHLLIILSRYGLYELFPEIFPINQWTLPEAIKYLGGASLTFLVYFKFMHPYSPAITENIFDYETAEIIKMTYSGLRQKEISEKLSIDPKTVSRKLDRARDKMGARSDMELWEALSKKGFIVR